jgi:hypothetical protein
MRANSHGLSFVSSALSGSGNRESLSGSSGLLLHVRGQFADRSAVRRFVILRQRIGRWKERHSQPDYDEAKALRLLQSLPSVEKLIA